jgi:hypothetical protein
MGQHPQSVGYRERRRNTDTRRSHRLCRGSCSYARWKTRNLRIKGQHPQGMGYRERRRTAETRRSHQLGLCDCCYARWKTRNLRIRRQHPQGVGHQERAGPRFVQRGRPSSSMRHITRRQNYCRRRYIGQGAFPAADERMSETIVTYAELNRDQRTPSFPILPRGHAHATGVRKQSLYCPGRFAPPKACTQSCCTRLEVAVRWCLIPQM